MNLHIPPPARTRQLGRSHRYTRNDLPKHLHHWHAPRANRWEYLCVVTGRLDMQWLDTGGIKTERLENADYRWIAPGSRWRVSRLDSDACFQLEIHADDTSPASAPQALRAALLGDVACVQLDEAAALTRLLAKLAPGERCLARGRFDFSALLRTAMANSSRRLLWHPLESGRGRYAALIVCSEQPVELLEYLGRDHAVIEAALAGALRGNVEHRLWLCNVLARHLTFEETLLFPAYLRSGGNAAWIRGLCNEHEQLRLYLDDLSETSSQRRFLLLLDGHDEKEEQIVYPDIVPRLGDQMEMLTRAVMQYPLVAKPS